MLGLCASKFTLDQPGSSRPITSMLIALPPNPSTPCPGDSSRSSDDRGSSNKQAFPLDTHYQLSNGVPIDDNVYYEVGTETGNGKYSSVLNYQESLRSPGANDDCGNVEPFIARISDSTGRWNRISDSTGRWNRISDSTGRWNRISDSTGRWNRISDSTGRWNSRKQKKLDFYFWDCKVIRHDLKSPNRDRCHIEEVKNTVTQRRDVFTSKQREMHMEKCYLSEADTDMFDTDVCHAPFPSGEKVDLCGGLGYAGDVDTSHLSQQNVSHTDEDLMRCEKCGVSLPIWDMPEHSDHHFAQDLQLKLDRLNEDGDGKMRRSQSPVKLSKKTKLRVLNSDSCVKKWRDRNKVAFRNSSILSFLNRHRT